MADTWSGGVVTSLNGESPPTVQTWQDVSVPGAPAAFADETGPVAYRRSFPDPRDDDGERAELEVAGIYGHAHVWVNDTYLGDHEGPIEPARFPFEPRATNELVIACEPSPSTEVLAERPGISAVPGIRDGVAVHRLPETGIRSLEVTPTVADGRASLTVSATLETVAPVDDVVTFSLRPNGFRGGGSMDRTPVEAGAGERVTIETTIDVRDPKLWWPRGRGPQHRYTLRAKVAGRSVERTVGLRTIDRDDTGLRVNGQPVPARGVTIQPGDASQAAIDAAAAANATLVRFAGHVPPRRVYEACDDAGLLVWQDLPVPSSADAERAAAVGDRLYDHRYGNPSLAALGVRDTGFAPFDDELGTGVLSRLRVRWRAWRADAARAEADATASALPDELAAISLVGSPGTGADVVRLAPGWRYLGAGDVEWLLDRYVDAGAGGATVCSPAAVQPADDRAGSEHPSTARSVGSTEPTDARRSADGGSTAPRTDEGSAALQTAVESLRRRQAGFVLVEQPPDDGGATFECPTGGPTTPPAFGAVANAFEATQAVVEGRPTAGGSAPIWLLNDAASPVEATITCETGSTTETFSATLDAGTAASVGSVDVPPTASSIALTVETDDGSSENVYRL